VRGIAIPSAAIMAIETTPAVTFVARSAAGMIERVSHPRLRRDGWCVNQKKTRRIYRELGLQLIRWPPFFFGMETARTGGGK
jgi:hypothetical protein